MNTLFGRYTSVLTATSIALGMGALCFANPEPAVLSSRVFTETNAAAGNSILIYNRSATNGSLTLAQTLPTGGDGNGVLLEAQGAVIVVSHYLLAVNAGSDTITVANIGTAPATVVSTISSGGITPKSLTAYMDTVYVLNKGNATGSNGNINGFTLNATTGVLTPIAGSTQPLSGMTGPDPTQIGFTVNGHSLLVAEKDVSLIDVYAVNASGVAGPPTTYSSHAPNPYGFAVGQQSRIFMTEANAAAPFASSVSSYSISTSHVPDLISASVSTGQSAVCWAAVNSANTFLYVTDNESATISVYSVDSSGHITLIPGFNVATPGGPFDIAISSDQKNVYVLYESPTNEIITYTINSNGSLTPGAGAALPSNASTGLVVR
jgi:6-phosphogluconolactonase